mgnify:CR=1 FL=1
MKIVGFCNLKGGVGKTTACQNLAVALVRRGLKVAALDLDPHPVALAREHAPAGLNVLGPAAAPMERRAGRYRGQLLLQAGSRRELQQILPAWRESIDGIESQRRVRWSLDVDPVDLF